MLPAALRGAELQESVEVERKPRVGDLVPEPADQVIVPPPASNLGAHPVHIDVEDQASVILHPADLSHIQQERAAQAGRRHPIPHFAQPGEWSAAILGRRCQARGFLQNLGAPVQFGYRKGALAARPRTPAWCNSASILGTSFRAAASRRLRCMDSATPVRRSSALKKAPCPRAIVKAVTPRRRRHSAATMIGSTSAAVPLGPISSRPIWKISRSRPACSGS